MTTRSVRSAPPAPPARPFPPARERISSHGVAKIAATVCEAAPNSVGFQAKKGAALPSTPLVARLRSLSPNHNHLGPEGARALVAGELGGSPAAERR